jgi:prepilin signal peptidase PulO-like enzyme (type II secretory pathway)
MAAEPLTTDGVVAAAPAREDRVSRPWTVSPVVILLAVMVAAAALPRLGLTPSGVMAAGSLGVLVVLSAIDLQTRLLPNKILLPATAVVFVAQAVFHPDRLLECVIAAVVAAAITFAPALLNPAAMGMGDVKLAFFLGVLLGLHAIPALMLGFLATAPVLAVMFVLRGKEARRTAIPLGPFLALGAAIVMLAGAA